ncbi:MAG: thiol reductant ABC exporter subunit CydD, partial [Actinomycetaceae bacterium]|nr:thiol reductant ABC exporter subunit CydD [Actinomycetaceae bacterium]
MHEQAVSASVAALKESGHTVIIIAHRAAILDLADTIIDVQSASADAGLSPADPHTPDMSDTSAEAGEPVEVVSACGNTTTKEKGGLQ